MAANSNLNFRDTLYIQFRLRTDLRKIRIFSSIKLVTRIILLKWGIVKIKKHELYSLDISFENRILLVSISRRLPPVFTFCSRNRSRKHLYLYRHCGRPLCAEMKEAVKNVGRRNSPLLCHFSLSFLFLFFSFA